MQNGEDEFVATLILPEDYSHHLNQVAGVTTNRIIFLKRKFVSKSGFELVQYPVGECERINYKDERSVIRLVSGILLVLLICFIFYMVIIYWDSLAETRIKIGLLGLALLCGVRWVFRSRGHKLEFLFKDKKKLTWKSRAGDYKYKQAAVNNVIDFARSKGLLINHG